VSVEDGGELVDTVVPPGLDGDRLDRALSLLTGCTRSVGRSAILGGRVLLDGVVVTKPAHALAAGQRLVASLPPAPGAVAADELVTLDVVIDDVEFVVVNKPALVAVHPGAGRRTGTLVAGILARYPEVAALANSEEDRDRPGIVHRLDLGTSGLLVVAKTTLGLASLRDQVAARSMGRAYHALVEGAIAETRGIVDAPIARSPNRPTMMEVRAGGRESVTHYRVLSVQSAPRETTELELRLETGRTHQIRVHLASIGHPVVNDTRYGHHRDRRLAEGRLFLHAGELSFDHPSTGARVRATAPLPVDLRGVLAAG
jgi:23S rRNA pseudouridine1911/1915/1917 synthase